jgi:hypothetical protein
VSAVAVEMESEEKVAAVTPVAPVATTARAENTVLNRMLLIANKCL